jgi:hypothetical protein
MNSANTRPTKGAGKNLMKIGIPCVHQPLHLKQQLRFCCSQRQSSLHCTALTKRMSPCRQASPVWYRARHRWTAGPGIALVHGVTPVGPARGTHHSTRSLSTLPHSSDCVANGGTNLATHLRLRHRVLHQRDGCLPKPCALHKQLCRLGRVLWHHHWRRLGRLVSPVPRTAVAAGSAAPLASPSADPLCSATRVPAWQRTTGLPPSVHVNRPRRCRERNHEQHDKTNETAERQLSHVRLVGRHWHVTDAHDAICGSPKRALHVGRADHWRACKPRAIGDVCLHTAMSFIRCRQNALRARKLQAGCTSTLLLEAVAFSAASSAPSSSRATCAIRGSGPNYIIGVRTRTHRAAVRVGPQPERSCSVQSSRAHRESEGVVDRCAEGWCRR